MELSYDLVMQNLAANRSARDYPGARDGRSLDATLWPEVRPSFTITPADAPAIFTIGSCFARNIEEVLMPMGFTLPTRRFVTPEHERGPYRPNGILNEFNPAAMQQRILYALDGRAYGDETIVPNGRLYTDLLLPCGADVTLERARERRRELDDVYTALATSPYAIITLGLVEAWRDNHSGMYLNRMPPFPLLKAQPTRYSLHRLDAATCLALLEPALDALVARGVKIILTVSPVPLQTTMTRDDCVIANEYSKSTLRVCADALCRQFRGVDYFPSYEIVRSVGLDAFEDDHVHVKPALVERITAYMVGAYCPANEMPATA